MIDCSGARAALAITGSPCRFGLSDPLDRDDDQPDADDENDDVGEPGQRPAGDPIPLRLEQSQQPEEDGAADAEEQRASHPIAEPPSRPPRADRLSPAWRSRGRGRRVPRSTCPPGGRRCGPVRCWPRRTFLSRQAKPQHGLGVVDSGAEQLDSRLECRRGEHAVTIDRPDRSSTGKLITGPHEVVAELQRRRGLQRRLLLVRSRNGPGEVADASSSERACARAAATRRRRSDPPPANPRRRCADTDRRRATPAR